MIRAFRPASLLLVLAFLTGPARAVAPEAIERVKADVTYLAAPEQEGRGVGTKGLERAADHIAKAFEAAGLKPAGDAGGWKQKFEVVVGSDLGEGNRLAIGDAPVKLGEGYIPLASSDSAKVTTEVVFAGFGISASDLHHDDYYHKDVTGKAVLVVDGDPGEEDKESPFRKPEAFHFRQTRYKLMNAREHGARAVILVTPPNSKEPLGEFKAHGAESSAGVIAARVTHEVADKMLGAEGAFAKKFGEYTERKKAGQGQGQGHGQGSGQGHGQGHGHVHGAAAPGAVVTLEVELKTRKVETANVVGKLQGAAAASAPVVIGAHYDHLGMGGSGSLAPDAKDVHHGADDNASGTAGLMELARILSKEKLARDVIFIAFSAEESGILGSSHYMNVWQGPVPLLMINFDMIGRMKDRTVNVSGTKTANELEPMLEKLGKPTGLTLKMGGDGYGPSDHTSFYAKDVPVLFFFTGAHEDYHRPSDTAEKIDSDGIVQVAELAASIVREVTPEKTTLAVVRSAAPPPAGGGDRAGGYGPYFGSIPDFAGDGAGIEGVLVSGVRTGSPAEQCGVKAKDILVEFAGMKLKNLYDFTYALRSQRPGDKITVKVKRGTEIVSLEATLGKR